MQLDLGVRAGDSRQDRSGEIGVELLQRPHRVQGGAAQLCQALGVLLRLVEREIGAQLDLDFLVARECFAFGGAHLARRLALGEREIVDAILGHDPRRGRGDARPDSGLASAAFTCHGRVMAAVQS